MGKRREGVEAQSTSTHSHPPSPARIHLLTPPRWDDYELIDSGDGQKLERFGSYRLIRPETQAIWSPACSQREWDRADALFQRTRGDDTIPGEWVQRRPLPEQWAVRYDTIRCWARLTPFRHTGIFPEHSAHWGWMRQQLRSSERQQHVLVLFGYTGLHTLIAADAGARVCHVDASRPALRWARDNQTAAQLADAPVRWIVDDVMKFVSREIRRESRYDMIVMDPPIFGRGPKGEVWRLHEALPALLAQCTQLLSARPVGVLVHAYATNLSSLALHNVLESVMHPFGGEVMAGELALVDTVAGRPLPMALYARWSRKNS